MRYDNHNFKHESLFIICWIKYFTLFKEVSMKGIISNFLSGSQTKNTSGYVPVGRNCTLINPYVLIDFLISLLSGSNHHD